MAHSSRRTITTLDQLGSQSFPILRLRQQTSAPPPAEGYVARLMDFFTVSYSDVNESIEESADDETTRRNKKKICEMFDKMQTKLEKQKQIVLDEMDGLSPSAQEQVVVFWSTVQEWLMDVLNWLKDLFQKVLEKIKEGFKVAKQAIKNAFQWIIDALRKIM